MPSPFPGMNPYLEQDTVWDDFHLTAISIIRQLLVPQVRPNYIIKIEALLEDRTIELVHSLLAICERHSENCVTVVELLIPELKRPGLCRDQYLAKRQRIVARGINLVEIDLLRGGLPVAGEGLPTSDYCIMVTEAEESRMGVWPFGLRDALPTIQIPLKPRDYLGRSLLVELDLQAVVHRAYDSASYEDRIYRGRPQPTLRADDAAWAQGFIPK